MEIMSRARPYNSELCDRHLRQPITPWRRCIYMGMQQFTFDITGDCSHKQHRRCFHSRHTALLQRNKIH
jgi:hypothetical protein